MCGCVKPSTVMMDKIVQIFYKQKLIYMLIKIKKNTKNSEQMNNEIYQTQLLLVYFEINYLRFR